MSNEPAFYIIEVQNEQDHPSRYHHTKLLV